VCACVCVHVRVRESVRKRVCECVREKESLRLIHHDRESVCEKARV